jgi:hypothetical protein
MPKGVNICPLLRRIIWRQMITYENPADSVYFEIFDGDAASVLLQALKKSAMHVHRSFATR